MKDKNGTEQSKLKTVLKLLAVAALLYIFLLGIKLMGGGCKLLAQGEDSFAHTLISQAKNPFIALFVGIFVTSIVQSSAVTTSIVVALVAGGTLSLRSAIPIVMGANIGTTVTNMLVSMGYVMRKEEFRRAISGAVVHDLFNVFVVVILLPVELATRYLETVTRWLTEPLNRIGGVGGSSFNPLGPVLDPAVRLVESLISKLPNPGWCAGITAIAGLVCIFSALLTLIRLLRSMMQGAAESSISKLVGKSGYFGIVIGFVLTASVHSSSIVTSLLVPMAASGIMSVTQIFPITIGANIGTTTTALIAVMAGSAPGVAIALVHLLFNVTGLLMFYPMPPIRRVPIRMAERIGQFAAESRALTLLFGFCLFLGVPGLLIWISCAM